MKQSLEKATTSIITAREVNRVTLCCPDRRWDLPTPGHTCREMHLADGNGNSLGRAVTNQHFSSPSFLKRTCTELDFTSQTTLRGSAPSFLTGRQARAVRTASPPPTVNVSTWGLIPQTKTGSGASSAQADAAIQFRNLAGRALAGNRPQQSHGRGRRQHSTSLDTM